MLEHADRRDAVERPVAHVPVVLQADLDLAAPIRRRATRSRAHRACAGLSVTPTTSRAVVPGRVQGEGSPAAPDVEDPLPRLVRQPELAADEVVLRFLGGLEGVDARREPGAGVRHGGPEDHGVEVVADVVVVLHRLGIAARENAADPAAPPLRAEAGAARR